ncbi:MAG: RecQ family ATP-dependent DNA helicase [Verrucomicrobiales bacterium]|nr:RecQ family ATP-dependent DNA helicase [Verrucomicrobiales bacterium]
MAQSSQELLKQYFLHDSFRPGQQSVIEILRAGRSALAIFPTGGGKSLCYQLPALCFDGITLVVSPLIALMRDQVETLLSLGIPAARLDSTLELNKVREIYHRMEAGDLKLLYIAPERLANEGFMRRLRQSRISMLAVDEAHCISEWGHNFRPDYLKLAALAADLKVERVLALTATATPKVAADIRARFSIAEDDHIQTPFHRKNLTFLVAPCPVGQKKDRLVEKIKSRPAGPTIVYVTLQRTAEEVAGHLTKAGIRARAYHAGMRDDHRSGLQDDFMNDRETVIVATIAFGMGVDKSNIRYVYHYNLPKSLENYVQESGRAGRDGAPATCEILATGNDLVVLENFVYGDTPSRTAIKSLVEHLLLQGDQFHISKYDLSYSRDIRPLVVSTAITYLEMDDVLIPEGPFYANYRFQLLQPETRIITGHTKEEQTRIQNIFAGSPKARTWHTADIEAISENTGESEDIVRRTLDNLADSGDIKIKPAGLRHAYRLHPDGERKVSVLTNRLVSLFESRETGEIDRLQLVVDYCEAKECLTGRILEYFGDEPVRCGQCSVCTGENTGTPLPTKAPPAITSEQSEAIQELHSENHKALKNHRQLARFLCGLSSPATTRSRLNRHDLFGCLEEVPFQEVLAWTEALL